MAVVKSGHDQLAAAVQDLCLGTCSSGIVAAVSDVDDSISFDGNITRERCFRNAVKNIFSI
ncbi:MAG: hypothetical protein ACOX41_03100 [Anaerovoracaceae bacterium]